MAHAKIKIWLIAFVVLSLTGTACEGETLTITRSYPAPTPTSPASQEVTPNSQQSGIEVAAVASDSALSSTGNSTVPVTSGTSSETNAEAPVTETATPRLVPVLEVATATQTSNQTVTSKQSFDPIAIIVDPTANPASTPIVISITAATATPQPASAGNATPVAVSTATPVPVVYPADPAPTVVIESFDPQIAIVGKTVQLVNATSSLPVSGRAMVAAVNWGDGSGYQSIVIIQDTGEVIASHTYFETGIYVITLRVSIDLGGESTDTTTLVVQNPVTPTAVPTISATPTATP